MSISVSVRARPLNARELENKDECIIRMNDTQVQVLGSASTGPTHNFVFDNAFWSVAAAVPGNNNPHATQLDVFKAIGLPLIGHVFTGYNACVLAYGQTGSGKTYSMVGETGDEPGIIPRFATNIFNEVHTLQKKGVQMMVEVTFFEIYCEKVRDLLNPVQGGFDASSHLRVREHPVTGPYVEGLARLALHSPEEFLQLVNDGMNVRTTAQTSMNVSSSRSHAVFTVVITQKVERGAVTTTKTSKMNLVDLAGSERAEKSGATGTRLIEGGNINKSLSVLGQVISNLSEEFETGKKQHVPYRDSVLTWILKDNLGGNSMTSMLGTISPATDNYEETVGTLRYAERAKKIVNKAVINESNNNAVIAKLQREIEALKDALKQKHTTAETASLRDELDLSEVVVKDLRMSFEEKLKMSEALMAERERRMEEVLKERDSQISRLDSELRHVRHDLKDKNKAIKQLKAKLEQKESRVTEMQKEQIEADQIRREIERLESQPQKKTELDPQGGLTTETLGSRMKGLVGVSGKVKVRALAQAFEQMGKHVEFVYGGASPKITKSEDALVLDLGAKGDGEIDELDLELDVDDLDIDDLDLDLELDADNDVPGAQDDELNLDEDLELDLELEEDEPQIDVDAPVEAQDSVLNLDLEDDSGELDIDIEEQTKSGANPVDSSVLEEEDADKKEAGDSVGAAAPKRAMRARAFTVTASVMAKARAPEEEGDEEGETSQESKQGGGTTAVTISGCPTVIIASDKLPNNRFLREPFRVIKYDEAALISGKKERIWDVDFLGRKFNNLDLTGYMTLSLNGMHLFRVEKHWTDSKRVTLYFFDAPHPYDLIMTSTERRQRMFELAMIQRRGAILWCPSLCPDDENDAIVQVTGTSIQRQNGRTMKVKGDGKFIVARMPYEVIDFWFGCFSLQQRPLPPSNAIFGSFIPRGTNEVYVIGVTEVPGSLMGNPQLGEFFAKILGPTYFVLTQTTIDSKDKPKSGNNAIIVIVRRTFIVRVSHVEAVELGSIKKEGMAKGEFSAAGCSVRINESSLCCILVNTTPFLEDNNLRSANVRALLANFSLGNKDVDITTRFDYILVGGPLGYTNPFQEDDGLKQQMKDGNLMQDFVEGKPSSSMLVANNPMRILYWVRPRNCRLDAKAYDSCTKLKLANVSISVDIFTQRTFLSTFGEVVPTVQLILKNVVLTGSRTPHFTSGELWVAGEWIDGSPVVVPLERVEDTYVVSNDAAPPIRPVVSNADFLRLQAMTFSVYGVVTAAREKKKILVASGSFSLKNNVAQGETMGWTVPMYYRTCHVGEICGTIMQVLVDNDGVARGPGLTQESVPNSLAVHCDENQVLDSSGTWVPSLFGEGPWDWADTKDSNVQARREGFILPDPQRWKWASEWKHDTFPGNADGWNYATSWALLDFSLRRSKKHMVRRRRWTRLMQANDPLILHNYLLAQKK